MARDIRSLLCERPIGPPIYVSIGIALFNGSENVSVDDVLVAADMAMYQVKSAGGDDAAVYKGPPVELMSRVDAIHKALAERRFVLYQQPIFDLRANEPAMSELLIRMRSDNGDPVLPGEFLPLAERFALVVAIDRQVTEDALEIARHRRVSVNLSGRSVGDPLILSAVRDAVASGLDPANVVFELTETAVMTDFQRALGFFSSLSDLGCSLALDDFGTGFGSFTFLKHIPARLPQDRHGLRPRLASSEARPPGREVHRRHRPLPGQAHDRRRREARTPTRSACSRRSAPTTPRASIWAGPKRSLATSKRRCSEQTHGHGRLNTCNRPAPV